MKRKLPLLAATLAVLPAVAIGEGQPRWVGSWATSQQLPEPHNALVADDLKDATLRQVVHLSLGGTEVRVHLSNRFGKAPLRFTSVHLARPVAVPSAKIVPETDKAVTFSGRPDVIVPAGAEYVSDAVAFPVAALSDVTISLHFDTPPMGQTGHPGSRATSYITHGDLVSAADLPNAKSVEHWYFVSGVDVAASSDAASIVILGDSITDGHGATTNGNDRWPDLLAKRLQADSTTKMIGVLNQGIGGNRLLLDGLGPNALARFNNDVLAQAGVHWLIVLEGVNDLGMLTHDGEVSAAEHEAMVRRVQAAYEQIVARAHAQGIQVIGATILPYVGSQFYHPNAKNEADRQAANEWIRTPGHFDAVIDFDRVMRDPEHPDRLLPTLDSGDHLHPSPAGYAAMAEAVPLSLFAINSSNAAALRMALTFDDLPAHNALPPGVTRMDVATKILAALREAGVPPTFGFINAARLEQHPEETAVLEAWHNAGHPLGNHSWSHMNLNQHSVEEFQHEIELNEPMLSKLMKNEDWHWFRYPYLAEGDTPEKRAAVRSVLAKRGYKIAGVTMSFADYAWNEPYARCMAKGDSKGVAFLKQSYLAAADANIDFYRAMSQKLYGRDIPYVLLMHIGALDAEMLPELLKLYRSKGFQFVTLAEAEKDEFYKQSTEPALPVSPDTLEETMAERHLTLPARVAIPAELETVCRQP